MGNVTKITARQPLERMTVNLVPLAVQALNRAIGMTGHSKTDTVNRALQVYLWILENRAEDGSILITNAKGELQRVLLL